MNLARIYGLVLAMCFIASNVVIATTIAQIPSTTFAANHYMKSAEGTLICDQADTRILTDQGYQKSLKRIADIQVGDEVLAWDEVKAFDIAQAKENLKLQADLQAKSADSRQEICAECYENSSDSSKPPTMQNALLRSTAGRGMTGNSEA